MADKTKQAADADQFSDSYAEYIARKRAAAEPTLGDTENSGYRFSPAFDRADYPQGSRSSGLMLAYSEAAIRVEGPVLPLANHARYRATVWPLWREADPKKPRQSLFGFGVYYVCGLVLVVGWVVGVLLALIDIGWYIFKRPELERRYQKALADPSRPWAWTVSRDGWLYAVVGVADADYYGLRHPERIPSQPDRCVLEQVEVSKEAALEVANRVVARLSS